MEGTYDGVGIGQTGGGSLAPTGLSTRTVVKDSDVSYPCTTTRRLSN